MKKCIKTFEEYSTNTHIVNLNDLTNWSADRVVNNKNGKFSYVKEDDVWVKKDNISQFEQSRCLWMTEEESVELNNIYTQYKEISDKYKSLTELYKPNKSKIPDNRVW